MHLLVSQDRPGTLPPQREAAPWGYPEARPWGHQPLTPAQNSHLRLGSGLSPAPSLCRGHRIPRAPGPELPQAAASCSPSVPW